LEYIANGWKTKKQCSKKLADLLKFRRLRRERANLNSCLLTFSHYTAW
jgi:hypothetical protein